MQRQRDTREEAIALLYIESLQMAGDPISEDHVEFEELF